MKAEIKFRIYVGYCNIESRCEYLQTAIPYVNGEILDFRDLNNIEEVLTSILEKLGHEVVIKMNYQ